MSLIDDLTKINMIKADIKTAIENKGQTVTNFESYPDAINSISGGSEGGVKLFTTLEEMNADTNSTEGDLAIVYGDVIGIAKLNSPFQIVNLPDVVVLPNAVTESKAIYLEAVDTSKFVECYGQLSNTFMYMDIRTESSRGMIEYTSTDGITYTRASSEPTFDFGTPVQFTEENSFDEAIGYMLQTSAKHFNGLYKYSNVKNIWQNYFFYNPSYPDRTTGFSAEYTGLIYTKDVIDLINKLYPFYESKGCLQYIDDNHFIAYLCKYSINTSTYSTIPKIILANNTMYLGFQDITNYTYDILKVTIDMTTKTVTNEEIVTQLNIGKVTGGSTYICFMELPLATKLFTYMGYHYGSTTLVSQYAGSDYSSAFAKSKANVNKYVLAPTQLDAVTENVETGKVFYGANGIEIGSKV